MSVVREIKARREPRSRSRKVGRTNGELRTGTTLQLSLRKTVADLATPLDRYDLSQIDEMYRYELTCLVSCSTVATGDCSVLTGWNATGNPTQPSRDMLTVM